MNKKVTKLREALKKIEFKCSNEDAMQYMIAKYIVEEVKEIRKKRVAKTLAIDAKKICYYFNFQFTQDIENAFNELNFDLYDLNELANYYNEIVNAYESYSNIEEIEIRNKFKEDIKQEFEKHKDELSDETKRNHHIIYNDCFKLSHDKFRVLKSIFFKDYIFR